MRIRSGAPGWSWERTNRWLALGANLGVLLGLLVLIIEIRQNAALTRTAMAQEQNHFLAEIEINFAKPEVSAVWVKSIRDPEGLTDTEVKMLDGILVSVMLQWDHRFQMESAGLIGREEARQHVLNSAPYYFGSRFGRRWWSFQAPSWEGTPMMQVAGPIVDASDEHFLRDYLDSLRLEPVAAESMGSE